jgi:uncharacterized membrane protein YfcA
MTIAQGILLFLAAAIGGALNAVAGGGTFVVLPAMVLTGVGTKLANTTTTVALWPGAIASAGAYRKQLESVGRPLLVLLGGVSIIGGTLGALLLLHIPQDTFSRLLPFLLLLATVLFAFGGSASRRLREWMLGAGVSTRLLLLGVAVLQVPISIYGGFFGGGIGILMLATLGLSGMNNLNTMNALKTVLAACINGAAVITFVIAGAVVWPQWLVMIIGAMAGGYGGARFALRLDPRILRAFVIGVGCTMTLIFFLKYR